MYIYDGCRGFFVSGKMVLLCGMVAELIVKNAGSVIDFERMVFERKYIMIGGRVINRCVFMDNF